MNITNAPNAPPSRPPKATPAKNVMMDVNSTFGTGLGDSWMPTHVAVNMENRAS